MMRFALITLAVLTSAQREAPPEYALEFLDNPDIADYCNGVCVTAPQLLQPEAVAETNILAVTRPSVSAQI